MRRWVLLALQCGQIAFFGKSESASAKERSSGNENVRAQAGKAPILKSIIEALQRKDLSAKETEIGKAVLENQRAAKKQAQDINLSVRSKLTAIRSLYPWAIREKKSDSDKFELGGVGLVHQHSITAQKQLYDFNRLEASLQAISKQEEALQLAQEANELAYFEKASALLFQIKKAKMLQEALQPTLEIAQKREKSIGALFAAGQRAAGDVYSAESAVLRAQLQIQKAQQDWQKAVQVASAETEVAEQDFAAVPALSMPPKDLQSVFERTGTSLSNTAKDGEPRTSYEKIKLRELSVRMGAIDFELEGLSRDNYPVISAEAGSTWEGAVSPLKGDVFGSLVLNWVPPWLGKGEQQKTSLLLEKQKLSLQMDSVRKETTAELAQAVPLSKQYIRQWDLLNKQRAVLEKMEALVQDRYNAGRATILEISTAESELLNNTIERSRLAGDISQSLLTFSLAYDNQQLTKEILHEN